MGLVSGVVAGLVLALNHTLWSQSVIVETNALKLLFQTAILALPPASRSVLILREYEGLSYQEIADALDIPLGTVMSRLSYARNALKKSLSIHLEAA